MPSIDYFFATLSPYCYLAGDRLEKIAAKHDAQICLLYTSDAADE